MRQKRKDSHGYNWVSSDLVSGQIGINSANGTAHIRKTNTAIATLAPSYDIDVTHYGAIPDCKRLTYASVVSGSTNLECSVASFTSADIGKHVFVGNIQTYTPAYQGTIVAVVNSTNVTLSSASSNTTFETTMFYGTNNATAIQAALTAAGARAKQDIINPNNAYTTGDVRVKFPITEAGDTYLFNSTLTPAAGTIIDADAHLFANVGTASVDNRVWAIDGAPGVHIDRLIMTCAFTMGVRLGLDATHSSAIINDLQIWGVGTGYNGALGVPAPIGLELRGYDWRINNFWLKGGNVGVKMVNAADVHANLLFLIGCSKAIELLGVDRSTFLDIRLDTVAYEAGTIDSCKEMRMHMNAFTIFTPISFNSGRGLQVGENSAADKNRRLEIHYDASRTGGKGLVLSNTIDSRFFTNITNDNDTGVDINTGLEYGSGLEGEILVNATIDQAITNQVVGTIYGVLHYNGKAAGATKWLKDVTGTSYTLIESDTSRRLRTTNGSPVTITLPNNMPIGYQVEFVQGGAGQVTFTPASGATRVGSDSFTKTKNQYAVVTLTVDANSNGTSAAWTLSGNGAA